MKKNCVIGIDVGTTCTKALVVEASGAVLGTGSSGYSLIMQGDRVEQRAADWIRAATQAVRQAMAGVEAVVEAISLSTQAGSTVAVNAAGDCLGNAWTWMDLRCQGDVEGVEARLGSEAVYHATGWRINPSLDLLKLRRMKKRPEYRDAEKFYTTLEVMNGWLTGEPVIDPTNAALRQLYGIESGDWEDWLLAEAGVSRNELPVIAPTGAMLGGLCGEAARAMGLPEGIPVFNGAHDQYCASLGVGAVHDGDMLLSAGTTWVLMGITTRPMFTDSFIAPGRHPLEGLYGAVASLTGSGASMQWFKEQFMPDSFEEMNCVVARRRERAKDLFFYPYQAGANYPLWNAAARGVFAGITLEHDRFDFARAIMEGAAFGVRRAVEDFRCNSTAVKKIIMMGGAAKSELWARIISAVANVPLALLDQTNVCALGAAVIAACGIGLFENYSDAARSMTHIRQEIAPDEEEAAWYGDKFERFDRLWRHLAVYYKEI